MTEGRLKAERSTTDVKALLENHPSRPWTSENLSQVLQEVLASDVIGDDSDSSIDAMTLDDSDINLLHAYGGFGYDRDSRLSRSSRVQTDSKEMRSKAKGPKKKDSKSVKLMTATTSDRAFEPSKGKLESSRKLQRKDPRKKPGPHNLQVSSLKIKDSDLIDMGKISSRLIRKPKLDAEKEELPQKIVPRVNEMVNAIKTAMKYNLQPENFRDEDELEEKLELNRLLKSYKDELDPFELGEKSHYRGPSIKGTPTFRYVALKPKNKHGGIPNSCDCKTCKMNRLWVETKRKRADDLVPFLAEPRKTENATNVWHCQCKGPRPGFNNKNQMVMKIRVPQSMRPDELKKLNSVPRMEIYKHITPAVYGGANIKNAVIHKPQPARPIIQQEMMCHMNEMRCVLLPPPFTGKVTKIETPDWVVEYNKRYIYDYFFQQSKSIPNVSFMHFSYKKNLAVLMEEIIQGCMNRTDVFDEDTCQCTFLCNCAHKTVRNATLFEAVRQAKKFCAADLHDGNTYEAGDYTKSGDKTYFVCSKLCNARMKLHKQLHV